MTDTSRPAVPGTAGVKAWRAALRSGKGQGKVDHLAFTQHPHAHRLAALHAPQGVVDALELLGVGIDLQVADEEDDVAAQQQFLAVDHRRHAPRPQAQAVGRRTARKALHEQAFALRHVEQRGLRTGEQAAFDAGPQSAAFEQRPLGDIGGDGKTEALEAARARVNVADDADHPAVHVKQRPARVAAIDRRVGLQEFDRHAAGERAAQLAPGAEVAAGQAVVERVRGTDDEHRVADVCLRGVAEPRRGNAAR